MFSQACGARGSMSNLGKTTTMNPDIRNSRITNDTLTLLEAKLTDIAKTMRENKTIQAYEMLRQLQEFVAYERAKQQAQ